MRRGLGSHWQIHRSSLKAPSRPSDPFMDRRGPVHPMRPMVWQTGHQTGSVSYACSRSPTLSVVSPPSTVPSEVVLSPFRMSYRRMSDFLEVVLFVALSLRRSRSRNNASNISTTGTSRPVPTSPIQVIAPYQRDGLMDGSLLPSLHLTCSGLKVVQRSYASTRRSPRCRSAQRK
jgi:hypothetical protein